MGWIASRSGMASVVAFSLLGMAVVVVVVVHGQSESIPIPPDSAVELTVDHEGTTYKLIDGDLYRVVASNRLAFVEKLYDKDFWEKNYAQREGRIFRVDGDTGKRYPTRRHFEDGFENADLITDLIGIERGWNAFTLQSSSTPSVPEYVQLRNRILRGEAKFIDNRVEPSSENPHTGIKALKCYSLAPTPNMVCAKASLSTELLYFVKGDDVWFSGWYFIPEGGMPFTLMDLECTWIKEHPGMRIMIEDGAAMFELKWAGKPKYRQPQTERIRIPKWAVGEPESEVTLVGDGGRSSAVVARREEDDRRAGSNPAIGRCGLR